MFTKYTVLAVALFSSTSALAISTMQPVLTCKNPYTNGGVTIGLSVDQRGLMELVTVDGTDVETYGYNGEDNSNFIVSSQTFQKYGGTYTGYQVGVEVNGRRMTMDYAIDSKGQSMPHSGLVYTITVAGQQIEQFSCGSSQGQMTFANLYRNGKIDDSYTKLAGLNR